MELNVLEWIGYAASITIALSMTLSSIVKFRVVNLIGASLFSTYGFLIGALPVGILNGIIVIVDIYYLFMIFSKKEAFETLEVPTGSAYLLKFISFHKKDIQKFFPEFEYAPSESNISFYVLRNMSVAGLFLAKRLDNGVLKVELDYAIPELRDFKSGKFIYNELKSRFMELGYSKLVADMSSPGHISYLKKHGFIENAEGMMEMVLVD